MTIRYIRQDFVMISRQKIEEIPTWPGVGTISLSYNFQQESIMYLLRIDKWLHLLERMFTMMFVMGIDWDVNPDHRFKSTQKGSDDI